MTEFLLIISLIAPPILYFIEKILPYPYLLEELLKYFLVRSLFRCPYSSFSPLKTVVALALVFSFSENILYLPEIISSGKFYLFYFRLLFDGFLHLATFLLLFFGQTKNRLLGIMSLVIAIIVHYLFNLFSTAIIP